MHARKIRCPFGVFHVTAEPELRSLLSEICCLNVFMGEYEFDRQPIESEIRTVLDIGCNVGAFVAWASDRWPLIERIDAYDPNSNALAFAALNAVGCHIYCAEFHHAAVSVDPAPLFKEHTDWGGSRTHGETSGTAVPSIHPKHLPPADVVKCDCEGPDGDIFENYPHWPSVKVAIFEYHTTDDRRRMVHVVSNSGMRMVRCTGEERQGVEIWSR